MSQPGRPAAATCFPEPVKASLPQPPAGSAASAAAGLPEPHSRLQNQGPRPEAAPQSRCRYLRPSKGPEFPGRPAASGPHADCGEKPRGAAVKATSVHVFEVLRMGPLGGWGLPGQEESMYTSSGCPRSPEIPGSQGAAWHGQHPCMPAGHRAQGTPGRSEQLLLGVQTSL